MEPVAYNYSSARAVKARVGAKIGGIVYRVLVGVTIILLLGGASLLIMNAPVGWIPLMACVLPAMIVTWYDGELKTLQPSLEIKTIDDCLVGDILGQLGPDPTPRDVATVLGRSNGGLFYGVRFGVTPRFLQDISSETPYDMPAVWREAMAIRQRYNLPQITAGMLVLALVRSFPNYQSLLAHLSLDDQDLVSGIFWQEHLAKLIALHARPRRTGGIARDWSFGYTPHLQRFGQNISEQIAHNGLLTVDLEAHAQALDQMIRVFTANGRQNVALVGPTGVGKTTLVHAFAEMLLDASSNLPNSLKFRQIMILDAAAILSAAPGRGELETLVMQLLGEAYTAKNVIVCLDNAQLFFEEGVGSVDLTNILLPVLEGGRLRVILTMDEQRYLQIGQRNSALINALNRISIAPATKEETLLVLQDQLIITEFQRKVTYMYQALEEAYRLSERYVHDLAMPGRAIKLMESAAGYGENGLVTVKSVQQAIEQTMDIKVGVAQGDEERDKLLKLEELIRRRMIGQARAVQVVSDALRRARAGVRNPNRPIGTFLFLGPTGVGKTELAKTLGDVYFGGEDRLIRLDLNEYVRSEDVIRLIADGANDPASLTAQIMKQPFSVVLLDEIEKAHPNVLTTLLQLLDEGILRDSKNREVSFRDAIVIATSNAGADRIREYIERGYRLEQFEQQFTNELIGSNQFRPEFLNRFDEIVIFQPLTKDELVKVIDLILAGINRTLALQKISVIVTDEAKLYLVEKGYDPRLGARPMRRVVQRAVENIVARQMLSGATVPGSMVTVTLEQVKQMLDPQA